MGISVACAAGISAAGSIGEMSVHSHPSSGSDDSIGPPGDLKNEKKPEHPLAALVEALVQLRSGRSVDEVAGDLEIPPAALGRWVTSLDALLPINPDAEIAQFEDDEIRRLRLENEYLRQQRDLYRKACGLVPPPIPSSGNS